MHNRTSVKTPELCSLELPGWWAHWKPRWVACPERAGKFCEHSSTPSLTLCISFILLFLRSMNCSGRFSLPRKQSRERPRLGIEVWSGGSLARRSPCHVASVLTLGGVTTELNWKTPSGCLESWRIGWCWGKNSTHLVWEMLWVETVHTAQGRAWNPARALINIGTHSCTVLKIFFVYLCDINVLLCFDSLTSIYWTSRRTLALEMSVNVLVRKVSEQAIPLRASLGAMEVGCKGT